jgi:hypothetical protein
MYLPASRPDPIVATDSSQSNDFAALAQALAERGGVALVYAPSTTTITNTTHSANPAPVEVCPSSPAGPLTQAPTQTTQLRPWYTLGEVIAYSGFTLSAGGVLSILVTALLPVPELVPVLGGSTGLVGMLTAVIGLTLDNRQREA